MAIDELNVFSPLPPERNGIADYAFHLLSALSEIFSCTAFTSEPFAAAPNGIAVVDHLQAFRYLRPNSAVLHQIGNNPGHSFVLDALRRWGGISTLHDQSLHYLYETSGAAPSALYKLMLSTSERIGSLYAAHWRDSNIKTAANYAIFDMLSEVLRESSAVVVHSEFAKRRIRKIYGKECDNRVFVIPHLAIPFNSTAADNSCREAVNSDTVLLVTAGFATAAKRFDWLIAALNELCEAGVRFLWIHAGEERSGEYDLSGLLDKFPLVRARCRITGFLAEAELNNYLAASDILVNLRFPSVGESSGSLSRAMSAGRCCVVSNTAAYAELPRDAVVHVPLHDCPRQLAETLKALAKNKHRRLEIGECARQWASTTWAPRVVAASYATLLRERHSAGHVRAEPEAVKGDVTTFVLTGDSSRKAVSNWIGARTGPLTLGFEVRSSRHLAELGVDGRTILRDLLPVDFEIRSIRMKQVTDTGDSDSVSLDRGRLLMVVDGVFH